MLESLFGEPLEPRERHRLSESTPVVRGVDSDHEDLPKMRLHVAVDLGPAEADQRCVVVIEPEAVGLKPRFIHHGFDCPAGKSTLLGMPVEGAIVDSHELVQIVDRKSTGGELAWRVGKDTAQLP